MNPPPDESSPLKRELLGHVWVDSGRLALTDPSYLDQLGEHEEQWLGGSATRCQVVEEGLAMVFQTGPRTGRYPVYVTRFENGSLVKVEVVFDERAAEME